LEAKTQEGMYNADLESFRLFTRKHVPAIHGVMSLRRSFYTMAPTTAGLLNLKRHSATLFYSASQT